MRRLLLILTVCILSLTSCEKFLDTKPVDSISPEYFYENESQINMALAGVYDVLGSESVYGNAIFTRITAATDESYFRRSNVSTGIQVLNLDPSDMDVKYLWQSLYEGINRANMLLANIKKPQMDDKKRAAIEGEALFLRAYYHFLLVSNWGDVPLMLNPTKSVSDIQVAKTPVKDVYEQILKDMTRAETLVRPMSDINFGGKVSKSAVQGILARVNLYMAGYPLNDKTRYTEVVKWAKKVMEDTPGYHALNPDYKQVFINYQQDKYDPKESIWEVEFWGNRLGNAYVETGRVGNTNGIECADVSIGYSYGFIGATPYLYNLYAAEDDRRDWSIATYRYTIPKGQTSTVATPWTEKNIYERHAGKFRRENELLEKNKNFTPQNFPLLRYSDVLLMFAEADNEINNGPSQQAVDMVNMVRRRGFSKGIKAFKIVNKGVGYDKNEPPRIIITGGGELEPAEVSPVISSTGNISGIILTKRGRYTATPIISIEGGKGTSATATAIMMKPEDADVSAADKTSQQSFRKLIQDERAREFCFEALRRQDLIRWGIFISNLKESADLITKGAPGAFKYGALSGGNVNEKHLLLPIPTYDLSLNKKLLQNNGW